MRRAFLKQTAALGALAMLGSVRRAAAAAPVTMWHIFGAETEPGLKNIKRWNDTHVDQPIDQKFVPFGQLSQQLIKGAPQADGSRQDARSASPLAGHLGRHADGHPGSTDRPVDAGGGVAEGVAGHHAHPRPHAHRRPVGA
jgi:hypothetical protein